MKISYVHPLDPAHLQKLIITNAMNITIEKTNNEDGGVAWYRLIVNGRDVSGRVKTPFYVDGFDPFLKSVALNDKPGWTALINVYQGDSVGAGIFNIEHEAALMPIESPSDDMASR